MSTEGTPRKVLGRAIQAVNPTYIVNTYPQEPANVAPNRFYVNVFRAQLEPVDNDLHLSHTLEVHVYPARTFGEDAETELEDILDNVLLAIQGLDGYAWTRAERVTLGENYPGYKITVLGGSENVYRQHFTKDA